MNALLTHLIKRILIGFLSLFLLVTLLFFLFRLIPGDPTSVYIDIDMGADARATLTRQFGLDRPVFDQYQAFLYNLLRGNFGTSFQYNKPALEIVGKRFWNTMILMISSLFLAYVIGIFGGTLLAWKRGSKIEITGIVAILLVRCAPVFWIGMFFILFFSIRTNLFPLGGMLTPGTSVEGAVDTFFNLDFLHHLILPVLTCGLSMSAAPVLVMRASLLEVIKEDFIESARIRGLSAARILFRHAMRNALLPIVTLFAVQAGMSVGGVVLVETVFRWPGMGREIVLAVGARDYPLIQTAFILIGLMVIVFNMLADMVYTFLDPRVSENG
jgi:peptide/nickel transport system permease protein